jgi:hypothetical protein
VADTSYLRYTVEPWIREQLQGTYRQTFTSQVLELRTGGRREFDAVSEDRCVVASVKAHSGATSSGGIPSAKINSALLEIYFLMLVPADERILVLTNPEFFAIFNRSTKGRVVPEVRVELMPLPLDMQTRVDAVTKRASDEMARESTGVSRDV